MSTDSGSEANKLLVSEQILPFIHGTMSNVLTELLNTLCFKNYENVR